MAKELWEIAKGPGQPPCFKSPQEMFSRACEYFKWCGEHFVLEDKIFKIKVADADALEHDFICHKRPMTQAGLCTFLNICVSTWHNYKKDPEYLEVTSMIESIIFENKFTGASTGQFNANIIARDLGLTDRQEIKMDNASVTPWDDISSEGD